MKVEMFKSPVVKTSATILPGDIFSTEFGDFGNWVNLVFEEFGSSNLSDWTAIKYHVVTGTLSACCYENKNINNIKFTVVGKEEREY